MPKVPITVSMCVEVDGEGCKREGVSCQHVQEKYVAGS